MSKQLYGIFSQFNIIVYNQMPGSNINGIQKKLKWRIFK